MAEGLGPTTNNSSCALCHFQPVGGWGEQRVTRYGYMNANGQFAPTDPLGDTLWQHVVVTGDDDCAEVIPPEANHSALRITMGSTGYGLIEAIPDEAILAVRDAQPIEIRGIERWVASIEDGPDDPPRLGKFGWKAQQATVLAFSAEAASAEMGITTWLVQEEPPPNGNLDLLEVCDEVADPETGVDVEGFDYLGAITDFQRLMAAPPRTPPSGMSGELIMEEIGCTQCHVPTFTTSDHDTLEDVLRNQTTHPYTDFLVHDMGQAGDGIQDGPVEEWWMKTPPLWGLSVQLVSWHDGRCAQVNISDRIRCAIVEHDAPGSQASTSALAFAALSLEEQDQVVNFLMSLGRRAFDTNRDGAVRRHDVLVPGIGLLDCLGSSPSPDEPCSVHDHDGDGLVDVHELDVLPLAWDDIVTDCNGNGQWGYSRHRLGL